MSLAAGSLARGWIVWCALRPSAGVNVLPVHSPAGRSRIATAASATISGERDLSIAASPPWMFFTASVAMYVSGHRQLAGFLNPRS